jgi:DNA-binding beta-propeller fold protein YncE
VKEQLGGVAPCWAVVNHAGTRLYVTNTGDASIEVYDLADPLKPEEIQHFVMDSTPGGAAFSTVIDASDQWLYVSSEQGSSSATAAANAFHSLKVKPDGTLTEPFSPAVLPVSGTVRAQGITVVGAQ